MAGCGIDKILSQDEDFVGVWALETFNGRSLPATVYDDGVQRLMADSAYMSIRADRTWSDGLFLRTVFQGTVIQRHSLYDFGTYTVVSATVRLLSEETGEVLAGRIERSVLTFVISEDGESNRYVFRRR